MFHPPGYTLVRALSCKSDERLHLAIREDTEEHVLVRWCLADSDPAYWLDTEFQLLHRLRDRRIPRALERGNADGFTYLALELMPGVPLDRWADETAPSTVEILELAIELTDALVGVHTSGIIHASLSPTHVLVNPGTHTLALVGFGHAFEPGALAPRGRAARKARPDSRSQAYGAPEASGLLDGHADIRSDLYALGAILYRALTGTPPFGEGEPRERIYAQLSRRTRSVADARSEIPVSLSRLIMRLIERRPEHRYASAADVLADLESCRKVICGSPRAGSNDTGTDTDTDPREPIDELPRIDDHLYGREPQLTELSAALARALHGEPQLVLVRGPSGSGKSALGPSLRADTVRAGGHLVRTSFEPEREAEPYAGIRDCLQRLVAQLLAVSLGSDGNHESSMSDASNQSDTSRALQAELGELGGVLTEFLPELSTLVRTKSPLGVLGPEESRTRLGTAIHHLIRAIARPNAPLVLCFDHLTYADSGSLYLLRRILKSASPCSLVVVLSLATDSERERLLLSELRSTSQDGSMAISELSVRPLDPQDISRLLGARLDLPEERVRDLARATQWQTAGQPRLIHELLFFLSEAGELRHRADTGWTWSPERIESLAAAKGRPLLTAHRLENLPQEALEIVALASHLTGAIDPELIADLAGLRLPRVPALLHELHVRRILDVSDRGYRLSDPTVRQASSLRISSETSRQIHYRIGRWLLAGHQNLDELDSLFAVAWHWNHAQTLLSLKEEELLREVNRAAGIQTLRAGDASSARAYLSRARASLRQDDWHLRPGLAFESFWLEIEAAFHARDFPACTELLTQVESKPLSKEAAARVLARQITLARVAEQNRPRAAKLALTGLQKLSIRWPLAPSRARVLLHVCWTDWLARKRAAGSRPGSESRADAEPKYTETGQAAPDPVTCLIEAGAETLAGISNGWMCLASAFRLRGLLEDSGQPYATFALVRYIAYRVAAFDPMWGVSRLIDMAMEWMERSPLPMLDVRAHTILYVSVLPWLHPRRSLLDGLDRIAKQAYELGDTETVEACCYARATYTALVGTELTALLETLDIVYDQLREPWLRDSLAHPIEAYRLLLGEELGAEPLADAAALPTERKATLDSARLLEIASTDNPHAAAHWVVALTFIGDYAAGSELSEELAHRIHVEGPRTAEMADFTLCRGLCVLARMDAPLVPSAHQAVTIARGCQSRLRTWAQNAPDCLHMELLLRAELARSEQRVDPSLELYEAAARAAREQQHLHYEALIQERRGTYLRELGRGAEAEVALREAGLHYAAWGLGWKHDELVPPPT